MTEADLRNLPDPVQRWLCYSRVVGSKRPTVVRLRQEGTFQLREGNWLAFGAEQYFSVNPPGFLWKARFAIAPFVTISGRDLYRDGTASMQMRVLSLIPVANQTGGGLDQTGPYPYIRWRITDLTLDQAGRY